MSKQKTALQTLIEWGDKMILDHPMKTLSFAEAIDKAEELLEMEKEQIIDIVEKSRATGLTAEYLLLTYGYEGGEK